MKKSISLVLCIILVLSLVSTAGYATGPGDCGGDPNLCALTQFTDAPKYTNWAHAGVEYCVTNGLMTGTSATLFSPRTSMSRAMLVTVLYRMEGEPGGGSSTFTDVKPGKWYSDAVSWAADNGIVAGMGGGKFVPNGNVTREQIATFLYRYANYKGFDITGMDDLTGFADADKVGKWYVEAMKWAVDAGLISGTIIDGRTCLNPKGNATREQVAAILMRYCKAAEKAEAAIDPLRIRLQPHNTAVPIGSKTTFTVAVEGGKAPYAYHWQMCSLAGGSSKEWNDVVNDWNSAERTSKLEVTVGDVHFDSYLFYRCVIVDALGYEVITEPVHVIKAG